MSDDFNATAAAARAVGKQAEGTLSGDDPGAGGGAENHASAEGADTSGSQGLGRVSSWREMMLSTGPSDSLDNVESPWDPERGGLTRIYRGIRKMTGLDGMPAIVDIVVGIVEEAHRLRDNLPANDSEESEETKTDDDDDAPVIEGVASA